MGVIRLADRRGLLTGDLSRVQQWGLRTLMLMEEVTEDRRRFDDRFTALRASLAGLIHISADELDFTRVQKLFPEFFEKGGSRTEEIVVDNVTEEELVDTTGTWRFENSTTTPAEVEEALRAIGQSTSVRLVDVDDDNDGWV